MKVLRLALVILCISACALPLSAASATGRVTFVNSLASVPPAAAASKRALAAVDQSETLEFSISFTMRSFAQLQNRIANGEKISPTEMESTYLPLANDYNSVVQWLSDQGFTITQTDDSRLIVFASGSVAIIQQALQVEMARVTVEGKDYSAAQTFPSLPNDIAAPVLGINGLQPYLHKRKHAQVAPQTGNHAPYLISEILKAYNGQNLGVTGANQKIAILIDTFPSNSDLTSFWTNNGIAQSLSNIEKIQVVSGSLPSVSGEETLDAEWTSGIAPGAKVRIYASRTLNDVDLDKCFQRIINDLPTQPQMHQLSISLGLGETYSSQSQFDTDAQFLATLAANGVSTFVSSGDDGSTPLDTGGNGGPLQVEYYASDPSVTAVGGTSITLNASTGVVTSETAWSGSGGGASIIFNRPSWQVGTGVPAGTKRLIPDVALAADPNTGAYVYLQGSAQQIGGTSWSAPTWAGFCALINEARATAGKPPLGLLNPSIYPLIGTTSFRDITSGNNSGGAQSGGKYTTTVGFDEVTGIGVPNVANLLSALVGQALPAPTISSFTPTSGVVNATVTITGVNFSSISAVKFNGTTASFSVISATQINALVPSGATSGPISVTNPTGTATSSTNFTVTNGAPAPSISGFTPTNGTVGDSITISGANFNSVSAVTFNGAAATTFTVNSASQITAIVPAAASTGKIAVQTPAGTALSAIEFIFNAPPSTSVVISQIYGGGGNNGATYTNDFVELFNLGSTTVDLSTWSVQYASATGSTWLKTNLTGMIQPGHYYLVQLASGGAVGASLPAANATGTTNISATKGKLALVNNQTALTSCGDSSLGVVDEVGYGTSADCFEGNAAAPAGSNTLAILRLNSGCTNSNNNNSDFTTGTPTPRNGASPIHNCTSPDLTLTNTHTGNFQQGNTGSYTITVTNSGTAATSGTVTMTDTLPSGLSAAGFSGIGWTFDLNTLTATRSDALAPGISYPSITLTVNVASTAPSNLANLASVSGGGESNLANDSASDPTNVRTPSEAWREQWFGTTQNSGNAADSYIAAGDGMPNLLKYAFNLNPLVPAVAPITYDITNGHLRMTVTRNPNAFDISFFGEVTGDLTSPASWTTDNTTIDQNTSSLLQVHDNADLTAPHYIHLKVTRP